MASLIQPLGVGNMDAAYLRDKAIEENQELTWGVIPDAFAEGTMVDEVRDSLKLMSFQDDPEFQITPEMRNNNVSNFSKGEADYLEKSRSKAEYIERENNIKIRRERQQRLSSYGNVGTAATLIAGFVDPVSIVAGVATGGVGKAIQMGRLATTLAGGTVAATESYLTGKYEQAYNPHMSDNDVLIQTVMGGGLGLGAAALTSRGSRVAAKATEDVERVAQKEVLKFDPLRDQPRDELSSLFVDQPDVDIPAIRKALQKSKPSSKGYDANMQSAKVARSNVRKLEKERTAIKDKIAAKQLDQAQAANVKGKVTQVDVAADTIKARNKVREKFEPQIKQLEAEIENTTNSKKSGELYSQLTKLQTRYEKGLAKASAKSASKLEKPVEADPKLMRKLDAIETQITEAQANVKLAEKNASVRNKARNWQQMSLEQRVKSIFGDDLPRLSEDTSGSVGAAKVRRGLGVDSRDIEVAEEFGEEGFMRELDGNVSVLGDNILGDIFNSVYTGLMNSKSDYVKGLAYRLFENPQGATRSGEVAKSTASIDSAVFGRMMRTAGGGAHVRNQAFREYIKANGKNVISGHFDMRLKEKWNRDIMYALDSNEIYNTAPQYIKDSVDSMRAQFGKSLSLLKQYGVKGFEDVEYSNHYVPKVISTNNLINAVATYGQSTVRKVISEAYQTGGLKLNYKAADRLAEIRMRQILQAKGSVDKPEIVATKEDLDYLRKELSSAGVDAGTIEDIIQGKVDEMDATQVSDRAKASLKPNMRAELGGLSYYDLMNHDVENIMESYIREAAGNVAMKKNLGVSSYRAALRLLDSVKKTVQDVEGEYDRVDAEFEIIKKAIDVIYGKSINPTSQAAMAKGAQRLRAFTSIIRLQAMGLTNLGELPRVIANQGIRAVLESNPLMTRQKVKELGRKDLEEVDEILDFAGEDWAFEPTMIDTEAFDELNAGGMSRMSRFFGVMDNALAGGQRVAGIANLFRVTQGTGERASIRGVVYNLKQGKVTEQQARDAGWMQDGVNRLDDLNKFMKEYPAESEGRKLLNVEKLKEVDPELFADIQRGVMRLSSRDMQRMHVGETPLFMNNWIGQTLSQFRTFPYASLSKQLIHDVRGDRAVAATTLMYSLGMAYLVSSVRTGLLAAGDPNKDFDDVWGERMEGTALGYNLLNTSGQLASVSLGLDALASFNLLPEEMMASQENDFIGASPLTPPVKGIYDDVTGITGGAWQGDGEEVMRHMHNLTPFAKTIGISQMISTTYK